MVAYSYKKQFVPQILAGTKLYTLRANGKRAHATVGQMLQFYCAMRTKHCFKIMPDLPCTLVGAVEVDVGGSHIRSVSSPFGHHIGGDLDDFAVSDGFEDASAMHAFWVENHGTGVFHGRLISWNKAYL